jgi:hypothetical protein
LDNGLSVGEIVGDMMGIQNQLKVILETARTAQDDSQIVMAIKSAPYEDHVIMGTVIALTELTGRTADHILSYHDVLSAITFLDTLDVQNLRITGK